jgi:galactan endo-1,6-beta-galactosidase
MIRTLCLVVLTLAACGAARAEHVVKPDPGNVLNTWEGWGCSLAWWATVFGNRDDMADALFTTKTVSLAASAGAYSLPGLGMTIARYNVGGTSSVAALGEKPNIPPNMPAFHQVQGFWRDGASDDPASPSFDWTADASQRAMLAKARDRGANHLEAFSDSPMWWMCANHSTAGSDTGGDNLPPANRRRFARYLAIVARQARDRWGVLFTSVEPFNEPSAGWWKYPSGQEGAHFDIASQRQVLGFLREELDARGLQAVGVAASDENSVDDALRTWKALDGPTRGRVARVNVHGYSGLNAYRGPNRAALHEAASAAGKPLWDSEYGESDGSGLTMARSIVLDINESRVSGWVYWQPFDSRGWGLVQSNPRDGWVGDPNAKYYVLAQFSRHIRPGMSVVDSGDPDTVAAYDAAARALVLVTVNDAGTRAVAYDLSAFGAASGPVEHWATAAGAGDKYAHRADIALKAKTFHASLGANTVHTFVIHGISPVTPAAKDSSVCPNDGAAARAAGRAASR